MMLEPANGKMRAPHTPPPSASEAGELHRPRPSHRFGTPIPPPDDCQCAFLPVAGVINGYKESEREREGKIDSSKGGDSKLRRGSSLRIAGQEKSLWSAVRIKKKTVEK